MRYRFAALAAVCLTIAGFSISQAGTFAISAGKNVYAAPGAVQVSNAPKLSSTFCINYDEEIIFPSVFSSTTVTTDLTNIANLGIKCIRMGSYYSSTSTEGSVTWNYRTAIIAHQLGIETRCMIQGPQPLTSALEAGWMYSTIRDTENGQGYCDRTDIDNEQVTNHDGTLTDSQVLNDILSIATTLKADHIYTGPLSYSAVNGTDIAEWEALASGGTVSPLDQICVNIYTGNTTSYVYPVPLLTNYLQTFYSYFPNGCISEWNTSFNGQAYSGLTTAQNDLSMALAMQVFRDFNKSGQIYYFTYSNPLGIVAAIDAFAVYLHTGTFQSWWSDVFAGYANGTY